MPRKSIYIKDDEVFASLQEDIKYLWFNAFGESLSKGDIIVKALVNLKEGLTGKKNDFKRQNIYKYSRTGLSDK